MLNHPFKLTISLDNEHQSIFMCGDIADKDWSLLNTFVEYADELIEATIYKKGKGISMSLNWREDAGLKFECSMPNEEDVDNLLIKLRPFVLIKEKTYFPRICNVLNRNFQHPLFQRFIKFYKDIYLGKNQPMYLNFFSAKTGDDTVINSEKTLNDWLNSMKFHRDSDKREKLQTLYDEMKLGSGMIDVLLVNMLLDRARVVLDVNKIVKVIVGKVKRDSMIIR